MVIIIVDVFIDDLRIVIQLLKQFFVLFIKGKIITKQQQHACKQKIIINRGRKKKR